MDCTRFNPLARKNETIRQENLTGERALYRGEYLEVYDTVFHDGESPLKESRNIKLFRCEFQWKYPLGTEDGKSSFECLFPEREKKC